MDHTNLKLHIRENCGCNREHIEWVRNCKIWEDAASDAGSSSSFWLRAAVAGLVRAQASYAGEQQHEHHWSCGHGRSVKAPGSAIHRLRADPCDPCALHSSSTHAICVCIFIQQYGCV